VQNIEGEAILPSSVDWRIQTFDYFYLLLDSDLLDLILQ
jgi:hypothetical protein